MVDYFTKMYTDVQHLTMNELIASFETTADSSFTTPFVDVSSSYVGVGDDDDDDDDDENYGEADDGFLAELLAD